MTDPAPFVDEPRVLGEVDGLWGIYKPAGLAVHPTAEGLPHLLTWLDQADVPPNVRPMHRLDRGTSGVVLCSADITVKRQVEAWFIAGEIKKTYRALVVGRTRKKGVIRRKLPNPNKKGAPVDAVTRWRLLQWLGPASLIEARPETGRKHQIRRHMAGLGHPVVGDTRHGPRKFKPIPGYPGRLWLHALSVALPGGVGFEAPLPANLKAHLALLEAVEAKRAAKSKG